MKITGKRLYAVILLVGFVSTALWFAAHGWDLPRVPVPLTGPAPGTIEVRASEAHERDWTRDSAGDAPTRREQKPVGQDDHDAATGTRLRIVDERDAEVAFVEVRPLRDHLVWRVGDSGAAIGSLPDPVAMSDEQGRVSSPDFMVGTRFICSKEGTRPTIVTISASPTGQQDVMLRQATGVMLEFVDELGVPVQGARLLLPAKALRWSMTGSGDSYFEVARSDNSGKIRLWNDLVPYEPAAAVSEGFSRTAFLLPPPSDDEPTRIVLRAQAAVTGRVLNGNGLGGSIAVIAESESYAVPSTRFLPMAPVREDGSFSFESLGKDIEWQLTPCVDWSGSWSPCGPSIAVTAPSTNVELTVTEGFSVSVRALDDSSLPIRVDLLLSTLPRESLAGSRATDVGVDSTGMTSLSLAWPFGPTDQQEVDLWLARTGFENKRVESVVLRRGGHTHLGDHVLRRAEEWEIQVLAAATEEPVQGAIARFIPADSRDVVGNDHPLAQETTTDVDGMARLSCTEHAQGVLLITAEGYGDEKLQRSVGDCGPTRVLLAEPGVVEVQCETVAGAPVPGTTIQWRGHESRGWRSLTSGDDGLVEFEVSEGDVLIRHAPGIVEGRTSGGSVVSVDLHHGAEGQPRLSQEVLIPNVLPGERRALALVVPAMSELVVHVTIDGQPAEGCRLVGVPGTRLDIVDNDLWGVMSLPKAAVAADGMAELSGMPVGTLMLCTMLPETRFVDYLVIEVHRQIAGAVHMDIETGHRLVEVIDEVGKAVVGAQVVLTQRSFQNGVRLPPTIDSSPAGTSQRSVGLRREGLAVTDELGVARFTGVPAQGRFEASLSVVGQDHFAPTVLEPREVRSILRAGSGASLGFSLRHEGGGPAAGVDYLLRDAESRLMRVGQSDQDGKVTIGGLAPGAYRIWLGQEEAREVSLIAGQTLSSTVVLP